MTRPPLVTICPSFYGGTGMEQNAVRGCCQVKAAHGIAFLIRFGIPAADQHYAGSRAPGQVPLSWYRGLPCARLRKALQCRS